ncbi:MULTISPECIES: monooxygenase [unclassified Rhodococcus (in: high G+C Gram-positive bacteria)]|uniref:monooxygenase n=1 Tax=unclassified Rhodococcus (in: high G+C Gram-positive bacteria) TaxID=192944 RepID=UPI00163AC268|nr:MULTISPECIES: monooxygenase [unclassified Rhodococcus (in: high G+C Gram-positive bacteria)]MBC2641674.1 monooxygenase [Rhodococcus sp. 3A]MBC2893581.1 monooxygenase [Rhodococcus sp. 4CII]
MTHPTSPDGAVVIGAGMGGLLAAAALAGIYRTVTVLERDVLPETAIPRRCVPQARHVHALLAGGQAAMEDLLPGFVAELLALGATGGDALGDIRWVVDGHRMARETSGVPGILASRALVEWHVRRRVRALPNVRILDRSDVAALTVEDGRMTGVSVQHRGGALPEVVAADLVVDSSGRSSQSVARLGALGFAPPSESRVAVDVTYATRHFRLEPPHLDGDSGIGMAPGPSHPRSGFMGVQEDGTWIVTLAGYGDDVPPLDAGGFLDFVKSFPAPDMYDALRTAAPVDDGVRYRIPTTIRRHFSADDLPSNYLPFADAICSFNPIYGQGMSVAAVEATVLRDCLRSGRTQLARRFLRGANRCIDAAWNLTVDNDLRIPAVPGRRSARVRMANAYASRIDRAAAVDPAVGSAFLRVTHLLDRPGTLLRPSTVLRVLLASR